MGLTIETVSAFFDFLEINHKNHDSHVFRGVRLTNYPLIPSIGRCLKNRSATNFTVKDELRMLASFKMKAFPYLNKEFSTIELLALAQHHGLPTRLLDWTWNPLVAFYFAVRTDVSKGDSVVYVWKKDISGEFEPTFDPFKITKTKVILPPHLTNRIIAQSGIFTVHHTPNKEFISNSIYKIIIKNSIRKEIKRALYLLGIHEASMFPGIEGIASYTKWLRTNIY